MTIAGVCSVLAYVLCLFTVNTARSKAHSTVSDAPVELVSCRGVCLHSAKPQQSPAATNQPGQKDQYTGSSTSRHEPRATFQAQNLRATA